MAPALSIATAATSLLAGLNVTSPLPSSPSTPTHTRHSSSMHNGATVTIPVVLPPSASSSSSSSSSPCPPTTTAGLTSPTHGSCKPNFQGQPVHIRAAGSSAGWCVPDGSAEGTPIGMQNGTDTAFRLEFTGQPQNDYIIRLYGVPDNGLLVQPYQGRMLELCDVLPVNSPSFEINCDSCRNPGTLPQDGAAVASGCTIRDTGSQRFVTDGSNGTIGMDGSSDSNSARFDFVSAGRF